MPRTTSNSLPNLPLERPPRDRLLRRLPPLLVLLVGSAIVSWGWDYGPDAVVDFGREAYVPWRLSEGELLYRDVNYFNGPLSPYVNAAAFRIFGPSLRTLKGANLAVIAVVAALVYALAASMSDRVTATAAALVFLVLFAASQYVLFDNYNFLTPYSHELTHGIALSLIGIWSLDQWRQRPAYVTWSAMAGVA